MLELLVRAETEHLLATAGGVALLQALMDHVKELFELEGSPLFGEYGNKFLCNQIGESAGEGTFALHNNLVF